MISIHAARVGSDNFSVDADPFKYISIHAARVGSDFIGQFSPHGR